MRTACWTDYELIDASDGDRLERWGDVLLIRPDPQVIWRAPRQEPRWQAAHAVYHRSERGGGSWTLHKPFPESWTLGYKELTFRVRPTGFKHTGLFPEQAVNWDLLMRLLGERERALRVLNLFAYTGGATLACLHAGASVCHVDASKGMVQWARENAALSGLAEKPVRWIVDDCEKFVAREIRRGRKYDVILMDPPSYGRGPSGEIWKLEEKLYPLLELCVDALSDDPVLFVLNSYTTGLSPSVMAYLLETTVGKRFGGRVECDEIGLPVSCTGGVLPCGSTAIWERA